MGTVEATLNRARTRKPGGARGRPSPKLSAAQLRDLLDRALSKVDGDEVAGSLLRAAGLRIRFRFPDLDLVLNVASSDDRDRHLRWTFSDPPAWEPKLDLVMDSQVANAYLQGRQSLAIAIARRRVRCSGETRSALIYVPALRLVADAYRRIVHEEYPQLELG